MSKNKKDRAKIWGKILAGLLAALTVLSIVATCIVAIIDSIG